MTTEQPIPSYLAGFSERPTAWRNLLPEVLWTLFNCQHGPLADAEENVYSPYAYKR